MPIPLLLSRPLSREALSRPLPSPPLASPPLPSSLLSYPSSSWRSSYRSSYLSYLSSVSCGVGGGRCVEGRCEGERGDTCEKRRGSREDDQGEEQRVYRLPEIRWPEVRALDGADRASVARRRGADCEGGESSVREHSASCMCMAAVAAFAAVAAVAASPSSADEH